MLEKVKAKSEDPSSVRIFLVIDGDWEPRNRSEVGRKGPDHLVEERRVQHCQACQVYYNRDITAAQCFCVVAETLLKTGHRPAEFTQPQPPT